MFFYSLRSDCEPIQTLKICLAVFVDSVHKINLVSRHERQFRSSAQVVEILPYRAAFGPIITSLSIGYVSHSFLLKYYVTLTGLNCGAHEILFVYLFASRAVHSIHTKITIKPVIGQ